MDLVLFSQKGGRAKSPAKTAANRRKIAEFWKKVRLGKLPAPRRNRKFSEEVKGLARKYIWWKEPEAALEFPARVIAQIMDLGTWEDAAKLEDLFKPRELKRALRHAEAGWLRDRSWRYWHYRLGLTPWGAEPPLLPHRSLDAS